MPSQSFNLAESADPVAARLPPVPPLRHILVAVDESDQAQWAVSTAAALIRPGETEVVLLHVVDTSKGFTPEFGFVTDQLFEERRGEAEQLLRRSAERLPAGSRWRAWARAGEPARVIAEAAGELAADLIVMGTHARGRLAKAVLGSTAESVIRRAPCPVMTVAHSPPAPPPTPAGAKAAGP